MKPETLERAIKIKKELEELESLRRITYIPYPQIVNDSDNRDDVNTAYFSKEVLEKFKEVIRNFVNEEKERLTKSTICQLIKYESLNCTFRNKRKAQIQPCGDVYSSLYGYFNLEDDYDENLHNKNDSRFDIISVDLDS